MRKSKFPTSIRVLGVKFQVKLVDDLWGKEECWGMTLADHRIIKICTSQNIRRRWLTLWHEVVHATLHANGIGNFINEDLEEVLAQSMEHSLEQFMDQTGDEFTHGLDIEKEES